MAEMSGPINQKRWLEFAKGADNSNVLFIRSKEKNEKYYDNLFKNQKDFSRYEEIHKEVAKIVGNKRVLDIGCGRADVSKYIKNYQGFDFSKEAIKIAGDKCWVGSIYDKKNYKDADIYLALEVLEHVDESVLDKIPRPLLFSVPNFNDESHLRTYNQERIKEMGAKTLATFGWNGKWEKDFKSTNKIYLNIIE